MSWRQGVGVNCSVSSGVMMRGHQEEEREETKADGSSFKV